MKMILAATAAATLIVASQANAEEIKRIEGIEYFSDQVWSNQLDGDPVVAFPLGCESGNCDFTIWLDHFPGIGQAEAEECRDDPETSWWDCEIKPTCVLWAEFGEHIMPLTDWHGYKPDNPEPMDNAIISVGYLDQPTRSVWSRWNGHDAFHGWDYQLLQIIGLELEITGRGLCRAGLAALYHPRSKTVYAKGLLLPR
jgi:hypothetical protein